ncbi:type I polyketide synthase [Amycolatopsis anabasis]|uniref:type I polyketide synthase n=1 Tax=Amycolatopsis anabasis TaxID=1840409 RepID=UPI00131B6D2B|nr:type I polyketide synthase [Amycolatopsis anabasis]
MRGERIAIVGIGLTYPDAGSPDELWDNVLAGRRAFRRIPDERLNRDDYWSPDPAAPDRSYVDKAAVLRDFEFDRVRYKIAGSTFRATDLTHWLALDVAARALADAGFPGGRGLPRRTTGVILGNSLTGEFSRANVLRLRWPYVRRTVAAALAARGWDAAELGSFLADLERQYKAPFPEVGEDTLAGGLANTIAGRICNYFDLAGGGFTVDGACSSSLLSVTTAANALIEGDLDVALAGGVDLSIDPFETIGFAKVGALATGEMKVYDRGSNGFWPGEGCGVLVLMREQDALARGSRLYASITGWGVSSDGKGGITRPEAAGHRLALRRAYARAGYGVETVSYFEGHGTGTEVGDTTEIDALSSARRDADAAVAPAALSTIKGNIGHTKAAAGVAGLIKAALAVHHQVIPPATGHYDPHPLLLGADAALYVPTGPVRWPGDQPIRAGVSAMGFGGINTHVALTQAPDAQRRETLDERARSVAGGRQDVELLLFDADDPAGLRARIAEAAALVPRLSFAELTDLAGALAKRLAGRVWRAAVVAAKPEDAERKLTRLLGLLDEGTTNASAIGEGVFLAGRGTAPRIAFLFPGQGSGNGSVGMLRRRFAAAEEIFRIAALPTGSDQVATEVAQPRIVAGSLAAVRVLRGLGIEAATAVGHSLGELTALHWGGALTEREVLRLAAVRGAIMATASGGGGAMAGLATTADHTERLMAGEDVVIAGYNAPGQTVISGPSDAVARVCARARADNVTATRIRVSHAFHSRDVEPAAAKLTERLDEFGFAPLARPVLSTVTGDRLPSTVDLRALLRDQVVLPVRFHEAAANAARGCDLAVEVGPGRVLAGLFQQIAPDTPVLSTDTDSDSLGAVLRVVGAAFAFGAPVDTDALFADRVVRPLALDGELNFLANLCEQAPPLGALPAGAPAGAVEPAAVPATADGEAGTLALLRKLAAERVELPLETVTADTHPLDDLHLSSITVGQLVNDVTRTLGRPPLEGMPSVATARLGELAELIDRLSDTARPDDEAAREAPGFATWVRPFSVEYVESARAGGFDGAGEGDWSVFAPPGHPLAEPLRAALAGAGLGDGVLLCLPAECDADQLGLFLDAGRAALAAAEGSRFVVVQHRFGASGLAKTLHLERPSVRTTIVELPEMAPAGSALGEAVRRVVAEVAATTDFAEVRYDPDGTRTIPRLRLLAETPAEPAPLGAGDVLLVTGGGKGITAESALVLARDSGAALALLGRSDPAGDAELGANLARIEASGIRWRYERADVTSPEQVRAAVDRIQAGLGPVTAVLHGAGINEPVALSGLTEEAFRATVAPKVDGLRAILAAVEPDRLALLVTFGSIIGRAGVRGEAHYATANDWMTELALRFGASHPRTRVLALEWSVWSGAGMGERLGVVESLKRDGITPISTEQGIDALRRLLAVPAATPLVVTGRAAGLPTLTFEPRETPLRRFADRVLVHYPSVELVTEADLSAGSDPYLGDHLLDGALLFPAVLGMEAMAQVAGVLIEHTGPPLLENAEFLRPVVVPPAGATTIRLAGLVQGPGTVDVVLRSSETGFAADHFRARLRFPRPEPPAGPEAESAVARIPVDPATELYGGILFQGKRFQRLTGYRRVRARQAVAEIATGEQGSWFAPFLPQELVLADPGARDAMMHAIQCCVPDATLLPQRVDRLYLAAPADRESATLVLDARERSQDGDSYVYDLVVRDLTGTVVERWEGLVLRAVRKRDGAGPWVPAMLGPHLERALERVLGAGPAVVVEPDPAGGAAATVEERRARTRLAVGRMLAAPAGPRYRPDGKPEVDGVTVSASHGAGLTLAVLGSGDLACDVEAAAERGEPDWAGLLGPGLLAVRDLLTAETGDSAAVAGTRLWSALECVRKTGSTTQELALHRVHPDGWVTLSAGNARVATWVTAVNDRPDPVVFAVLTGEGE